MYFVYTWPKHPLMALKIIYKLDWTQKLSLSETTGTGGKKKTPQNLKYPSLSILCWKKEIKTH